MGLSGISAAAVANVNCGILRRSRERAGGGGHRGLIKSSAWALSRVPGDSKLNQIVNKHWDEGTLVGQFQLLMKFLREGSQILTR